MIADTKNFVIEMKNVKRESVKKYSRDEIHSLWRFLQD